jgi:hypothetical protein
LFWNEWSNDKNNWPRYYKEQDPERFKVSTFYRLICNIISVVSRRRNKRTDYSRPVTYGCYGQQYLNILTGATAYPCGAPEFTPSFFLWSYISSSFLCSVLLIIVCPLFHYFVLSFDLMVFFYYPFDIFKLFLTNCHKWSQLDAELMHRTNNMSNRIQYFITLQ